MKEFKKSSVILNEKSILDKVVTGEVDIPNYWYDKLLLVKLFQYFYDLGTEDIVGEICRVLEMHNGSQDIKDKKVLRNYVETEVKDFLKEIEKGNTVTKIYDLKEPINIYASEVESIKKLESLPARKLAFGILMLTKIEMSKHDGQERYLDYYLSGYTSYSDVKSSQRTNALNELYRTRNN